MQSLQSICLGYLLNTIPMKTLIQKVNPCIINSVDPEIIRNWASKTIQFRVRTWLWNKNTRQSQAVKIIEYAYLDALSRRRRWRDVIREENQHIRLAYSYDTCYHIHIPQPDFVINNMEEWTTIVLTVDLDSYTDRGYCKYYSQLDMWITRHDSNNTNENDALYGKVIYSVTMNESVYGHTSQSYQAFWIIIDSCGSWRLQHNAYDSGTIPMYRLQLLGSSRITGSHTLDPRRIEDIISFILT
jgi:hypothetical protein